MTLPPYWVVWGEHDDDAYVTHEDVVIALRTRIAALKVAETEMVIALDRTTDYERDCCRAPSNEEHAESCGLFLALALVRAALADVPR